jgi:hypothetical protein
VSLTSGVPMFATRMSWWVMPWHSINVECTSPFSDKLRTIWVTWPT